MTDPVLVEVLRGPLVESRHRGSFAVVDADGILVASVGDILRPVFPRSTVKAIQALPLVESGAADDFTDAELALACASHSGEPAHVQTAAGMLAKIGLGEIDLGCGVHWPTSSDAAHRLAAGGGNPTQLHNNCSGKHAGFLCLACHEDWPVDGYVRHGHPVQEEVRAALAAMTGEVLDPERRGIDGCSIPSYAIPLRGLALAFARLGSGTHLAPERAAAAARIRAACAAEPFHVAGTGQFDTELMRLFGRRLFLKTGAEGVYCAALPQLGIGFAVKMDDGARRAAEVAVASIVRRFLPMSAEESGAFERFAAPELVNWNGIHVGRIRPAAGLTIV